MKESCHRNFGFRPSLILDHRRREDGEPGSEVVVGGEQSGDGTDRDVAVRRVVLHEVSGSGHEVWP
jgi:hypothetical protein